MADPALEALRQQQILHGVAVVEPGLTLAVSETMRFRTDPAHTPVLFEAAAREREAHPGVIPEGAARPHAERLMDAWTHITSAAVPYWVAGDTADMVIHAAESRPPEPLAATDVPCATGFVWFDGGVRVGFTSVDETPSCWIVTSMLWHVTANTVGNPGVWVTFFTNPLDPRDSLSAGLRRNRDLDPFSGTRGFSPSWSAFIPFATDLQHEWWQQIPATFFHLVGQTVTATTVVSADKHTARWVSRSDSPILANTVTVITLRPPTRPSLDEDSPADRGRSISSGRKVTVRFVVGEKTGGFWRNQYYPSTGEHRPIWVLPYLKGPDGAPFVWRRSKVYAWRR